MNLTLFDEAPTAVIPKGVSLTVNIPELITKELKLSILPTGAKRIRLSSNFLPLMGFTAGTRTEVTDLGVNQGLEIKFNPLGSSKIYQRSYTQRKNNPLEAQIDVQNQTLIDRAIPDGTDRLHFSLRQGSILVKPLYNTTFSIRKSLRGQADTKAFVAMTGGVDVHCLRAAGFTIDSILEYRPQESRDKNDLTETGALNAIANAPVRNLFNEDISKINMGTLEQAVGKDHPIGLLHLSLQCDDFSAAKTKALKQRSIENLDTSADLVYDGLRLIETVRPATVLIENVPGFASSAAGELMRVKLRKWGYFVTDQTMDAREYNGLTSRKRYYLVASVWPGFVMPKPEGNTSNILWDEIETYLQECRDVTHTGTVYKGIECGRARIITRGTTFAPTVMKSQNRMAKDSIFIEKDGKYFMPSENLLRRLNGIPQDFSLDSVSTTLGSEIIGQSIEYPMHHKLSTALFNHIRDNNKIKLF